MVIDSTQVTNHETIARHMQDRYRGITEHKEDMTLEEFTDKYNILLEVISQEGGTELEEEFNEADIKEALKNAKAKSAPGPSQQTPGLFKYIFNEIPSLLTKTLNELTFVPGLAKSKAHAWISHRTIVYIPKPHKEPNKPENLRPLSLEKTFYKLQTRILACRMANVMPEIITVN